MAYVELHSHSAYSFLDGASLPEEIAGAAAEHGYEAFALTDHDNVCGAMEFARACRGHGVRPIFGAELTVTDHDRVAAGRAPFHLTLLVADATGWHNLCRLLTEAHADTRPDPAATPCPPRLRSTRCSSATGDRSVSRAALATASWRKAESDASPGGWRRSRGA